MFAKLTAEQRGSLLASLQNNGWSLVAGRDAIKKSFIFKDFTEAFGFITKIALESEKRNHHPELFNVYNRVEIIWSTHDADGLTVMDTEMADICDSFAK